MGRKRKSPEEKKHDIHITLPNNLITYLKENKINISQLVEKLLKNYLNMK